jgi:exopolyphosphatase/guanosine-5'-triphosphate,3'-diphosphate pyrophosphatase
MNGLEILVTQVLKLTHYEQLNFPGLSIERRPVFIGAIVIVYATFKALNIEQMTVSDGALREGLIYDLVGRIYNHDIRSETSRLIAERYHTDKHHSDQIKSTIHYIVEQLQEHECFNDQPASLQFLEWAADLHEIGFEIAHSHYHKHSAYIIANGDLAGFTKQDQLLLSKLVRSQRKRLTPTRFAELNAPWRQYAPIMAVVFRLAALLHRNRHTPRPDFSIDITGPDIVLKFPALWLEQSPLTIADLEQERYYLKEAKLNLIYE